MCDVRAIKSLALHDESFHPNNLLGSAHFDGETKYLGIACPLKPQVIDFTKTITGAINQVDAVFAGLNFSQPMRERSLRFESSATKHLQCPVKIIAAQKQIEILRVSMDPGVDAECVSTTRQKWYTFFLKHLHGFAIEVIAWAGLATVCRLCAHPQCYTKPNINPSASDWR